MNFLKSIFTGINPPFPLFNRPSHEKTMMYPQEQTLQPSVSFTHLRKNAKSSLSKETLTDVKRHQTTKPKRSFNSIDGMNKNNKNDQTEQQDETEKIRRMKDIFKSLSKERREDILDLLIPSHNCFTDSQQARIDSLNEEIIQVKERLNDIKKQVQFLNQQNDD